MKKFTYFLAVCLTISLLSGCGSKAVSSNATAMSAPEAVMEEMAFDTTADMSPGEEKMEEVEEAPLETSQQVDFTEKIIYSAYLHMETTHYERAVAAVDDLVEEFNGFVEHSNQSGDAVYLSDGSTVVNNRFGEFIIRVPAASYEDALSQAGNLGNVTSSRQTAENITDQFTDQEARQESLEVQEERLLTMLEQSTDVETLIEIESRLAEVRYEIESIQRTLNNWQKSVDYSTIELSISEVEVYTPTAKVSRSFGEKVGDAFQNGMANFVYTVQDLFLGVVGNLLNLVIFAGAVVLVVFGIGKARKKLRRKPKVDDEEE